MKITLFMKRYEIIYVCDLIVGRFTSKVIDVYHQVSN